jgi:hypothetical protein
MLLVIKVVNFRFVLLGILFLVFVSSVSADDDCYIRVGCSVGDTAVFSVSGETNAHIGLLESFSYLFRVCCPVEISRSSRNPVVSFSGETNAHVENVSYNNYDVPVGFSGATCNIAERCRSNEFCVFKFQNKNGQPFNAHVYDCIYERHWSVCCEGSGVSPDDCVLTATSIVLSNDDGNGEANYGENITISGTFTGDCSRASIIQVKASNSDNDCVIDYTEMADMDGIFNNVIFGEEGIFSAKWMVPPVANACKGEGVEADVSRFFDNNWEAQITQYDRPHGRFTFENIGNYCGDGVRNSSEQCDSGYDIGVPDYNPLTHCAAVDQYENSLDSCDNRCECSYSAGTDPAYPGSQVFITYGGCEDDDDGDDWGEVTGTRTVYGADGEIIETTELTYDCQLDLEEVPFFDWLNFVLVLFIISGFYYINKKN